ncbi:MAG: Ig-like domain-containing protein, partial [Pseudohongiella sp.]|nr:Ig-like domain-containing protein [Pseudohongiella sp.]
VTLDKTIPTSVLLELESGVALTSSTFITNDRTILINNLESGATWEYRGTGASNWTIGSGSSLEISGDDGEKYVQIRQTDAAGNVQSMWDDITFTLDTTAPEGPSPYLASDSNISTDRITNNRLVNIDYLESGATWEYSLDGSTWTDGSGSSVAVEGSGEKTIRVRQTDQAGNVSDIESLSFTLDTSAPVAPSLALALDTNNGSDNITSSATINISGLESDATWEYNLNGGSEWVAGSGSSINVQEEGSYTLQVRQTDLAGNVSNAGSLSFTLDTTAAAPGIVLNDTGSSSTDRITKDGLISVTGIEENASWQYSLNAGSDWTTGSGSSFSVSGSASYDLRVRQTDVAGNTSDAASLSFTLDTTVPSGFFPLTLVNDTGASSTDRVT